ncbi:MAG: ring-hydroxylating oxygenase subunit alpha [Alphaproteobacteria bacterium]
MTTVMTADDLRRIEAGYHHDPSRSFSLKAEAYTDARWLAFERQAIFSRTWQWVCHAEKLRESGAYVTTQVAGQPICVVRDRSGSLRAFYNVCKHRAHELLHGEGRTHLILCPYHAWSYNLEGRLVRAPETEQLQDFDRESICLDEIRVEEFCGFVYVNLSADAPSLRTQSGDLGAEIMTWAPDVENLTFAHRLTYDIKSNWKNVVDNFLECYHCPVAHKDFCTLVDMETYRVTTHGIYSSHMAEAGKSANSAYSVEGATVRDHAVWWLWPNTCLMRYPGRGNMIVMHIVPVGVDRTFETYDFFFEDAEPNTAEEEAIRYIDEVLQAEDIALVESVQRGMATPAFSQGRIVHDPGGSGKSEHAVHHFHGLILDAYREAAA